MKVKHDQWGIGTVLYELFGGYQVLVDFDNHGKIQVLQNDCKKILEFEPEDIPEIEIDKENEVSEIESEKKQEGMCKGICNEFKASRPSDGKRYESGQLRCQICEIYITIVGTHGSKGLYCKCCNYRVRGKPRNRIYKAKLRNEEIEVENLTEIAVENPREIEVENLREIEVKNLREIEVENLREIEVKNLREIEVENLTEIEVENLTEIEVKNSDNLLNKKICEAFRLGIVPGFAVQDITVGREAEITNVENWLAKDSGSLMIIGQYGQGKSHIIRYIREKALNEGYLVAYCDIGEESQMHKPKSVFNTLMKSLVFRNGEYNEKNSDLKIFLILYSYFQKENDRVFLKNLSKFLKPGVDDLIGRLKRNYSKNELDGNYFASFIDYLCGDDYTGNQYRFNQKIAIHEYQTSASVICNILSSIGNMAASMNNSKNSFKGLILIFDEGETIDSPAYLSQQRTSGINLIRGLTEISNNNEELLREDISRSSYDGKYFGNKTNLVYSGMHKDTRFTNHKENHVKCLFAFVEGESEVIDILEQHKVKKIVLNDFTSDEKNKLIYKIIEIYKKAYDYEVKNIEKLKNILIKKLEKSNNTRSVIKITMEALDLIKEYERHAGLDEINYEKILR